MIRAVITDLDRTWLRSDKTVSPYTAAVRERLQRSGIPFIIATARPIRSVKDWLPFLTFDAAVYHGGAVTELADGTRLYTGVDDCRSIIAHIRRTLPGTPLAVEAEDKHYSDFDSGEIWKGIDFTRTQDFHEVPYTADKLIVRITTEAELDRLNAILPPHLYAYLTENTIAIIRHRNASKEAGLAAILENLGIAPENTVCFGDDYADAGMLKFCGCGVAVANAIPSVIACADFICGTNDEDGPARFLSDILEKDDIRI